MPIPSTKIFLEARQIEIDKMISLRRLFASELKKLRSLPTPGLSLHWWKDGLCVTYRAKLLDMRLSSRFLEKFSLIVPLESIDSTDDPTDGTRTFTSHLDKGSKVLYLSLIVEIPEPEGDVVPKCRKVQVGVDTHTYTSTIPRYELICD